MTTCQNNKYTVHNHWEWDCGWRYDCYYYKFVYCGSNEEDVIKNLKESFGENIEIEFIDVPPTRLV